MTIERLQTEMKALELFFPKKFRFVSNDYLGTVLEAGVKTQNGNVYQLSIELEADYPSSLPKAYIIFPKGLRDYYGNDLLSPSKTMHTMDGKNDYPQICHIWARNWGPHRSLMQVVMKARIWLEAFEAHKSTGRPLDIYLPEN